MADAIIRDHPPARSNQSNSNLVVGEDIIRDDAPARILQVNALSCVVGEGVVNDSVSARILQVNALLIIGNGIVLDRGIVCTVKIYRRLIPLVSTVFNGEAVDRNVAGGHLDTRGCSRVVDDGNRSTFSGRKGDVRMMSEVEGEGLAYRGVVGAWFDMDDVVGGDLIGQEVSDVPSGITPGTITICPCLYPENLRGSGYGDLVREGGGFCYDEIVRRSSLGSMGKGQVIIGGCDVVCL